MAFRAKKYNGHERDVSEAIESECCDQDAYERRGVAESAGDAARNAARKLGLLIEMLANKGLLTEEELNTLLSSHNVVRSSPND